MRKISIDNTIFEAHPDFYRAVLIVNNADNATENSSLSKILLDVASARMGLDVSSHPTVRAWDDAYAKFGLNPNEHPPAVKALLKRVAKGHAVPFINSAVALFNIASIKYALPCGGDDLDRIVGDPVLGIADGSESFVPLGQPDKLESPGVGEVIYFDRGSKRVMCRRWNWRNGDITKLQPFTRNMLINVDCLPPTSRADANCVRDELAAQFVLYCRARVSVDFLDCCRRETVLPTSE
jgi:DNA/RNA-binding domain of Phe-tRNA-synthetase-like protein